MENRTKKHWLVLLIACGFAGSSLGINVNIMGVFHQPVADDLNILVGTFAVQTTLGALFLSVSGLFINRILDYMSFKTMSIIGVILSSLSIAAMSFVSNPLMFNILGILRGTGAGLIGVVSFTMLINNWFEEKNGLALSITASFAGIVGVVLSPLLTSLIQAYGWRPTFLITAGLFALFNLPIILIPVELNPRDENLLPYGFKESSASNGSHDYEVKQTKVPYKSIPFLALLFVSLFFPFAMGLSQNLPGIALMNGLSLEVGAYLLSACMLANILFKLILGPVSSKIGPSNAVFVASGILLAGLFMIMYGESVWTLMAGSFLYGVNYFIPAIALALLSTDFFGKHLSNKVYPIFAFLAGVSGAFAVSVIGFIYDFTASYSAAIWAIIICVAASAAVLFIAKLSANKNSHVVNKS